MGHLVCLFVLHAECAKAQAHARAHTHTRTFKLTKHTYNAYTHNTSKKQLTLVIGTWNGSGEGQARSRVTEPSVCGSDAVSRYRVRTELGQDQAWCCLPGIMALWRREQENQSSRSFLSYIENPGSDWVV